MMNIPATERFTYLPALDVLRTFSVMTVLFVHGVYDLVPGGWIAVDVFFVISGYLITSLLLTEYAVTKKLAVKRFYARRFLRLMPALWLTIIIANLFWPYTKDIYDGERKLATLASFFYLVNILRGYAAGNLFHLWSLAVEEHFYLLWPFAMLFLLRCKRVTPIRALLGLIIIIALVKIAYAQMETIAIGKDIIFESHAFTIFKIDAILVGCLIAFTGTRPFINASAEKFLWMVIALAFAWVIFFVNKRSYLLQAGGFLMTNALCGLTVLTALQSRLRGIWNNNILLWLGKRSYGIYLYHLPVFLLLENYHQTHNRWWFAFLFLSKVLLTLLLAACSYRYLEQPFLRLKKRFGSLPANTQNVSPTPM